MQSNGSLLFFPLFLGKNEKGLLNKFIVAWKLSGTFLLNLKYEFGLNNFNTKLEFKTKSSECEEN